MLLLIQRFAHSGKKVMILPILQMVLIFVLSSVPGNQGRIASGGLMELKAEIQNLLHFPMYALLTFLLFCALANFCQTEQKSLKVALIIAFCYGLVDEVHQFFVPGRYMSLVDVGFNCAGVVFVGLYLKLKISSYRSTT